MLGRLGARTWLIVGSALTSLLASGIVASVSAGPPDSGSGARLLLAAIGAALLTAALVALWATYALTRPLRDLTRAALAMAKGEMDGRAPERGATEIAELGRAVNLLATERSRGAGELIAERDLLASILDGMREGVLVLGRDGQIVLANPAIRSMARLGGDVLGKQVIEAIRNAALQQALHRAVKTRKGAAIVQEIELGGLLPKRLLVHISRLASPNRGLIAVFHDVTELRRLETVRTDFVANVSHELRTPVTAISAAAETLMGGALQQPDDARAFVDVIDRHAKRLRQLVDDLLDLSRIEARNFRLQLVDIDVAAMVAQSLRLIEDQARPRGVVLEASIAPDVPRARADRRALEQVLFNLLENAIKYAGEGAVVTASARPSEGHVEISVSDNGPGISPQHLGRVFERFYRIDTGRSREIGGTGLGLSIVKHLVESMHGSIEAQSNPGKGARFTILLPRAQAEARPSPE
jgi:two-component system phosphate regulon sensor histidine kinase PhoR